AITDAQAESKLNDLKEREADFRADLNKLSGTLATLPDTQRIKIIVDRIGDRIYCYDGAGKEYPGGNDPATFLAMDDADRRELIRDAFDGLHAGGEPAGVYLTPIGPKRFTYTIRGMIGDEIKGKVGSRVPHAWH